MSGHPTDAPTSSPVEEQDPPQYAQMQRVFAELGRIVLDQPLGQYLQRVADLAARTLPGVDGLSVTLVEDGQARSAAFTSPVAAMLDERQYEAGFGPCLDAAVSGDTIRVDLSAGDDDSRAGDDDPRADEGVSGSGAYVEFADAARRQGVRAVVSVGMPVPQRVVGALNLYSTSGMLEESTVELARTFASYAAIALANASLHGSTVRLAEQLRRR